MPYTQNVVLRMGWFAALVLAALAVLPLTLSGAATSAPVLASTAQAGSPPVLLGTADSFAVLAGSTITNVGPTVINGNVGLHPGTAVVGFPPGTLNGAEHVSDAVADGRSLRCRPPTSVGELSRPASTGACRSPRSG